MSIVSPDAYKRQRFREGKARFDPRFEWREIFLEWCQKRIKVLAEKNKKRKKLRRFRGHEVPVHKAVECA